MKIEDYLPKQIKDKVSTIVIESDFDYGKNRSVQHYFVYLNDGQSFDAISIKELKNKAKKMGMGN